METALISDLSGPIQSTAEFHRRLQLEDPVHWDEAGHWVLTRYQDVKAVLNDDRFGHPTTLPAQIDILKPSGSNRLSKWWNSKRGSHGRSELDLIPLLQSKWLAHTNQPEHTRLRALITQAVSVQRLNDMRPRIQTRANELIDRVAARGSMELVADFAYPLAAMTIGELLGVPSTEQSAFMEHLLHGQRLFTYLGTSDAKEIQIIQKQAIALISFVRELIAARRREPKSDVISALLAAGGNSNRLSEDELLGNVILIAIAGHETTYQFLATAIWQLLQPPNALAGVKVDGEMHTSALQELLRYCCPVQITTRVALEDVVWEDKTIRRGQVVRLALAAANVDAEQFADPDRLELARRYNPHLTFGSGIHQCIGAPLARLETIIALEVMLRRLPNLKIQMDQVRWRDGIFRSPESLWVTF